MNGTAILFQDCPPIKDELWESLYEEVSAEQEALVEQLVSVLAASFLVVLERQLFDYLHGQWSSETDELRTETCHVPRNNDISERDFSGLDRLMRLKVSANVDFISGLILYTNNKTSESLSNMTETELRGNLDSAIKLAREKAKHLKSKKASLRKQRYTAIQQKKQKKKEKEQRQLKEKQKAQDDILIDGQCKSFADIQAVLDKYTTEKEKIGAIKRQLAFYKTLNISSIPVSKFFLTSHSKKLTIETLTENLGFIVERWKLALLESNGPSTSGITKQRIVDKSSTISSLKRKFLDEAEVERERKERGGVSSSKKKKAQFPGSQIIGKRIKHKFVTKN